MDEKLEFSPRSAESGELLEVGEIVDEEGESESDANFKGPFIVLDSKDAYKENIDLTKRYEEIKAAQERFFKISALGDLTSVYRNRPIWTSFAATDLIEPCISTWRLYPTSRNSATLGYISMLIHENTHLFFTANENAQLATDFSSVENASLALLDFIRNMVEKHSKEMNVKVLTWCCSLASELCEQNKGRPIAVSHRTPSQLFDLFVTCPSINRLVGLLKYLMQKLLDADPEECMTVLFNASKSGSDFSWIWQHIATCNPDAIVNHLFTVGSKQFNMFSQDILKKEKEQIHPSMLSAIIEEYNRKFSSLSEVFNFISRKGNSDLKNNVSKMLQDALESDFLDSKSRNLNMLYIFKLVTCSVDTLRILISHYVHLANPVNFIRGFHQILLIDKRLLLPTSLNSYAEFATKMLAAIELKSLGVIFKVMAYIAFEDNVFSGLKYIGPDMITIIRKAAFFAVEHIINTLLNISHTTDTGQGYEDTALRAFASDEDLQFIINIAVNRLDATPILLRYLHVLALKLGELKGAEIVARILFVCMDKTKLSIIPAFLYTTCPFYPNIMQTMYRNLFAFRSAFLDKEKSDDIDILIVGNLQTIFNWEVSSEENSPYKYFGFNPGFILGELFADLLSIVIEFISENREQNRYDKVRSITLSLIKFLTSLSPSKTAQKGKQGQIRTILFTGRFAYKTAIQLATIVKLTLCDTTSKNSDDLKTFRRLCSTVVDFYSNYCNALMDSFYILFIQSYVIGCMQESDSFFGENVMLNPWADTMAGKEIGKLNDDYSFIDAVEKMSVKKKVVQLAHSGIIGRGAKRLHPVPAITADQYFRREVFLDSVRIFCIGDVLSVNITNCKHLANIITELFCQDALASDMLFYDWDLEKETISRYLEITQRFNLSTVGKGLLNILSEVKPCLWYCLPILKAVLASILNRLEGAVHKHSSPTPADVDQVDLLLCLLRQSDMIPHRFEVLLDMLPEVSNYEGFLMLLEVWKFFQRRTVTLNVVNQAVNNSVQKNDNTDALTDVWEGDFEIYRLVIQKHITKLGYLFPVLFKPE